MSKKIKCSNVADYFLAKAEESEDGLSNLKLQKLVYYTQAFHLALYESPLFDEDICAWSHGPVIPELYQKYKEHGSGNIPFEAKNTDFDKFDGDVVDLLDEIYEVYGQYSAWKLRNLTHEEPPWQETLQSEVISHDKMKEFFKSLLVDEE